jgi:hypothetical protein
MQEWDGTEAQALEDSGFQVELDPSCMDEDERQERREASRQSLKQLLKARYEVARNAKVHTMIRCPVCDQEHYKTTYHKVFCHNQKTMKKRKSSCKDKYWNIVEPRGIAAL